MRNQRRNKPTFWDLFSVVKRRRVLKMIRRLETHHKHVSDMRSTIRSVIVKLSATVEDKEKITKRVDSTPFIKKRGVKILLRVIREQKSLADQLEKELKKIDLDTIKILRDLPPQFLTPAERKLMTDSVASIESMVSNLEDLKRNLAEEEKRASVSVGQLREIKVYRVDVNISILHGNFTDSLEKVTVEQESLKFKLGEIRQVLGFYEKGIERPKKILEEIFALMQDENYVDMGYYDSRTKDTLGKAYAFQSLYGQLKKRYNQFDSGLSAYFYWLNQVRTKLSEFDKLMAENSVNPVFPLLHKYLNTEVTSFYNRRESYNKNFQACLETGEKLKNSWQSYKTRNYAALRAYGTPWGLPDVTDKYEMIYHSISPKEHYGERQYRMAAQKAVAREFDRWIKPEEYAQRIKSIFTKGLLPSGDFLQTVSDENFKGVYFFDKLHFEYGPVTVGLDPRRYNAYKNGDETVVYTDKITADEGHFIFFIKLEHGGDELRTGFCQKVYDLLKDTGIPIKVVE